MTVPGATAADAIWALAGMGYEGLATRELNIREIKFHMILALREGRLCYEMGRDMPVAALPTDSPVPFVLSKYDIIINGPGMINQLSTGNIGKKNNNFISANYF